MPVSATVQTDFPNVCFFSCVLLWQPRCFDADSTKREALVHGRCTHLIYDAFRQDLVNEPALSGCSIAGGGGGGVIVLLSLYPFENGFLPVLFCQGFQDDRPTPSTRRCLH